jgi:DNA polymerase-3 subunit beta
MKFSVQKNILLNAINQVLKAVASQTTTPILKGIKIVATAKGIELTGSDCDISIVSFIPCEKDGDTLAEIEKEGSIVLQGKFFNEIIKKLPKDNVTIEVKELVAHIKSGKSKFQLNGLDAEEYPRLPIFDDENTITLSAKKLKEIIKQTAFAVSKSETRPILTGVHWQMKANVLICTATDSHRLSRRELSIKGLDHDVSVVIPGKSLTELNKILEDIEEDVDIIMTNNQIIFCFQETTFYTRLLEGNFPDTSRLIPSDAKTTIVMNVGEFSNAMDRVSVILSNQNTKTVKMDVAKEEMFIKLEANAPEMGTVNEDLLTESQDGEDLSISFSSKFMMDALKTMNNDVEIRFNGSMRPFVLQEKGNTEFLQLILPVRTY